MINTNPQLNIFPCCTADINAQIISSIYHRMYAPGNLRIVQKYTPGNLRIVQKNTVNHIVFFHHLEITDNVHVSVASEK